MVNHTFVIFSLIFNISPYVYFILFINSVDFLLVIINYLDGGSERINRQMDRGNATLDNKLFTLRQ